MGREQPLGLLSLASHFGDAAMPEGTSGGPPTAGPSTTSKSKKSKKYGGLLVSVTRAKPMDPEGEGVGVQSTNDNVQEIVAQEKAQEIDVQAVGDGGSPDSSPPTAWQDIDARPVVHSDKIVNGMATPTPPQSQPAKVSATENLAQEGPVESGRAKKEDRALNISESFDDLRSYFHQRSAVSNKGWAPTLDNMFDEDPQAALFAMHSTEKQRHAALREIIIYACFMLLFTM